MLVSFIWQIYGEIRLLLLEIQALIHASVPGTCARSPYTCKRPNTCLVLIIFTTALLLFWSLYLIWSQVVILCLPKTFAASRIVPTVCHACFNVSKFEYPLDIICSWYLLNASVPWCLCIDGLLCIPFCFVGFCHYWSSRQTIRLLASQSPFTLPLVLHFIASRCVWLLLLLSIPLNKKY